MPYELSRFIPNTRFLFEVFIFILVILPAQDLASGAEGMEENFPYVNKEAAAAPAPKEAAPVIDLKRK